MLGVMATGDGIVTKGFGGKTPDGGINEWLNSIKARGHSFGPHRSNYQGHGVALAKQFKKWPR